MTRSPAGRPLLAATLIVRDETGNLPRCLASLAGVVDEVCVHDTGSVDGTPALARAAGARVLEGSWHDDFARARNTSLDMTEAVWSLTLDADEVLLADAAALRALLGELAGAGPEPRVDVLHVTRVNVTDGGQRHGSFPAVRIVRTATVRFEGRVHEQPVRRDGRPPRTGLVPPGVARLDHSGYDGPGVVRAKALRNLALAQAELDALAAGRGDPDPERAARVLFDLGRSALGAGQLQRAVDAFETLRDVVPAGATRAKGTALLAQLLLDQGGFEEAALVLEADLRAGGTDPRYCDWLRAQALLGLGDAQGALPLLRGIDALVDPMGVDHGLEPVLQALALACLRTGRRNEAAAVLARSAAAYGPPPGQTELLLDLWAGRAADLAACLDRVRAHEDAPGLERLRGELAAAGERGALVLAALRAVERAVDRPVERAASR